MRPGIEPPQKPLSVQYIFPPATSTAMPRGVVSCVPPAVSSRVSPRTVEVYLVDRLGRADRRRALEPVHLAAGGVDLEIVDALLVRQREQHLGRRAVGVDALDLRLELEVAEVQLPVLRVEREHARVRVAHDRVDRRVRRTVTARLLDRRARSTRGTRAAALVRQPVHRPFMPSTVIPSGVGRVPYDFRIWRPLPSRLMRSTVSIVFALDCPNV
jgi:hypothetical protein